MKFGGTSVQDEEAIGRVISIVRSRLSEKPLVVVSALARVTRLLCEMADEAGMQNEGRVRELLSQLRERHFSLASNLLSGNPELLEECNRDIETLISGVE